MVMKIGCVATAGDYPVIREAGYDYVEFSGRGLCALDEAEFRELKGTVRTGGLPIFGLNAYCPPEIRIAGPGFSKQAAQEYAKRCLARAMELDVQVVGVGSPMSRHLPDAFDRVLAIRQAEEFFAITAQVFKEGNITVCVEALGPCYCNFINRLLEAQSIRRAVDMDNLKLVADFYNMEHVGEADIPLAPFADDIFHAHISDDDGSPSRRWFLKPEKRELHISRVKRLYASGYKGNITMETDLPADLYQAKQSLCILKDAIQTINQLSQNHKEE